MIETESGYRVPYKTNNLLFNTFNRFSIIFDLNDFEDEEAYVFHWNLDYTENELATAVYFDQLSLLLL